MTNALWKPTAVQLHDANLTAFIKYVRANAGAEAGAQDGGSEALYSHAGGVGDYASLWRWSVDYPQEFWAALWRFFGVIADGRTGAYLDDAGEVRYADSLDPWDSVLIGGERMAPPDAQLGPLWFPGANLNFAENVLRHCFAPDAATREALVCYDDQGRRTSITFARLYDAVMQAKASLHALGVNAGDTIATYLPQTIEAAVVSLAAASLGAVVFDLSFPSYLEAMADQLVDVSPRLLFFESRFMLEGERYDLLEELCGRTPQIPSIEHAVAMPGVNPEALARLLPGALTWELFSLLGAQSSAGFTRLPFSHPLALEAKAIIHPHVSTNWDFLYFSAGGVLLQELQELSLHADVKPGDRVVCHAQPCNKLLGCISLGATAIALDGDLDFFDPVRQLELVHKEQASHFVPASDWLALCEKTGFRFAKRDQLEALRCVFAPVERQDWSFAGLPSAVSHHRFYRHIAPHACLLGGYRGHAGGCCFALANMCEPVYAGVPPPLALGVSLDTYDADGNSTRPAPGKLVCTRPFPSMPLAFWNDPDGAHYHRSFFSQYPGVWYDGSDAQIDAQGRLIIAADPD